MSEREKSPDAEEASKSWEVTSSISVEHKQDAQWINRTKEQKGCVEISRKEMMITQDKVNRKLNSMLDRKVAGPDKIKGLNCLQPCMTSWLQL